MLSGGLGLKCRLTVYNYTFKDTYEINFVIDLPY